jgi:sirohydrochlorin ferrochelatase
MTVHGAFLESAPPSGPQVINQLVAQGEREIVFVPLDLNNAIQVDDDMAALVHRSQAAFPQVRFKSSRPIGPEVSLLNVLDARMRSALSHARCLELDALVLSCRTAGDVRGAALLARRARQWSTHHHLPCVTAVADETGPSVARSILSLRSQGRRHIAVGSFFLAGDEAYHAQAELAYHYGAVSVSEPIGAAREVLDLVLARYAFAAMELIDFGFDEEPAQDSELAAVIA